MMKNNNIDKLDIKPFTALAPIPAVLVSVGNMEKANIITVAWCGIVNSDKPMLSISIRPERYSYKFIKDSGEFVVNLLDKKLCRKADIIGTRTGEKLDKFKDLNLTKGVSSKVKAPFIVESPCNIECKVVRSFNLGSHDIFIAEILNVKIDSNLKDKKGRICFDKIKFVTYAHGEYFEIGKKIGSMGYAVRKSKKRKS